MRLAVEEINNSSHMLPNITLGYHVWDTCDESIYLQAALQLTPGRLQSLQSSSSNQMVAVVGPDEADMTLLTSQVLTFYRLPQVSCRSDLVLLFSSVLLSLELYLCFLSLIGQSLCEQN